MYIITTNFPPNIIINATGSRQQLCFIDIYSFFIISLHFTYTFSSYAKNKLNATLVRAYATLIDASRAAWARGSS